MQEKKFLVLAKYGNKYNVYINSLVFLLKRKIFATILIFEDKVSSSINLVI